MSNSTRQNGAKILNKLEKQLSYRAKAAGDGTYVVLLDGTPVVGATVTRISLAPIASHQLVGDAHYISGCFATVSVPGIRSDIENVPVVF